MMTTEAMVDIIESLSPEQYSVIVKLVDIFSTEATAKKSECRKIGVAPNISVPADFDDIDFDSVNFFGMNE